MSNSKTQAGRLVGLSIAVAMLYAKDAHAQYRLPLANGAVSTYPAHYVGNSAWPVDYAADCAGPYARGSCSTNGQQLSPCYTPNWTSNACNSWCCNCKSNSFNPPLSSGSNGTTCNITYSHLGTDLKAPLSTPVYAAATGTIENVVTGCPDVCAGGACNCGGGFGNHVIIKDRFGRETLYGHLRQQGLSSLVEGAPITCGVQVGQVGSSGFSTGPHVHFEVTQDDDNLDPSWSGLRRLKELLASPFKVTFPSLLPAASPSKREACRHVAFSVALASSGRGHAS